MNSLGSWIFILCEEVEVDFLCVFFGWLCVYLQLLVLVNPKRCNGLTQTDLESSCTWNPVVCKYSVCVCVCLYIFTVILTHTHTNCVPVHVPYQSLEWWMQILSLLPVVTQALASLCSLPMSLYSQAWVYFLWIDRDTSSWTFIAPLSDVYLRELTPVTKLYGLPPASRHHCLFCLYFVFFTCLFTCLHVNRMTNTDEKKERCWPFSTRLKIHIQHYGMKFAHGRFGRVCMCFLCLHGACQIIWTLVNLIDYIYLSVDVSMNGSVITCQLLL